MDHVFVMTYGRSGSTLLMGILNSIPGWLLRGENRNAMRHLYDFHRSGLAERARVDPDRASQPTHPWFGIEGFPEVASLQHIRALAEDVAQLSVVEHDPRLMDTGQPGAQGAGGADVEDGEPRQVVVRRQGSCGRDSSRRLAEPGDDERQVRRHVRRLGRRRCDDQEVPAHRCLPGREWGVARTDSTLFWS